MYIFRFLNSDNHNLPFAYWIVIWFICIFLVNKNNNWSNCALRSFPRNHERTSNCIASLLKIKKEKVSNEIETRVRERDFSYKFKSCVCVSVAVLFICWFYICDSLIHRPRIIGIVWGFVYVLSVEWHCTQTYTHTHIPKYIFKKKKLKTNDSHTALSATTHGIRLLFAIECRIFIHTLHMNEPGLNYILLCSNQSIVIVFRVDFVCSRSRLVHFEWSRAYKWLSDRRTIRFFFLFL